MCSSDLTVCITGDTPWLASVTPCPWPLEALPRDPGLRLTARIPESPTLNVPLDINTPRQLLPLLETHLQEDIMPFWVRHAIDDAGGINTCIADDGTLVSREKWLWSQWRAGWVLSEMYRWIEKKQQIRRAACGGRG